MAKRENELLTKRNEEAAKAHVEELELIRSQVATLATKNQANEGLHMNLEALRAELQETKNRKPDISRQDAEIGKLKADLEAERLKAAETIKPIAGLLVVAESQTPGLPWSSRRDIYCYTEVLLERARNDEGLDKW